jgi:hypothetical protein
MRAGKIRIPERKKAAAKPANGAILYRGPSMLDGRPIVAIITGLSTDSANVKTGGMLQTYILCESEHPLAAIASGADVSICGTCVHRGPAGDGSDRTCYVNVGQAAASIWRAYRRGTYRLASDIPALAAGRVVRLGAYGDPAAVPVVVWEALTRDCIAHTGYTHAWRSRPDLRELCMASADSLQDAQDAHAAGWRTFRVTTPADTVRRIAGTEAVCPASAEAGKKLTCADCRACNGTRSGRRGSIVISAHGSSAIMAAVRRRFPAIVAA